MGVRASLEIFKNGHWEYNSDLYHPLISRPSNLTGWGLHAIPVRGLPNDVSEQVKQLANQDTESYERFNEPTWMTFEEFENRIIELDYENDSDFQLWYLKCEALETKKFRTRIVFWMTAYT